MTEQTEQEWIGYTEDICYITGKIMPKDDKSRFTYEFDAWVSEEGQRIVEDRATSRKTASMMMSSEKHMYQEAYIIYREWYAQDEANAANDEFRSWHK